MTFDQFVSFCRDFGRKSGDGRALDEMYKAQGWDAEDRRRLRLLHSALEHLGPAGPGFSEEDEKKAFEYWWQILPGREELKREAWRRVFFEESCRRLEAVDVNQLSPEAREFYFELLEDEREEATLAALGDIPGADEWIKLSDGDGKAEGYRKARNCPQ